MLIVGQGLAGTLLAWELERNGADFRMVDAGHDHAASRVAAGIINPITGQRLVKSWRIDELLPLARAVYRDIERKLGVTVWRDMRVRRHFANETERLVWGEKQARGELAPYGGDADQDGFWIEGAAHVDVAALLRATRAYWQKTGRLGETRADPATQGRDHGLVIVCTGAALPAEPAFAFVPWAMAKGELLTVETTDLAPDVILNHGHWVLPTIPGEAKVGATYAREVRDDDPTPAARAQLEHSARALLPRPFVVRRHETGLRLTLPDKCPVVGRSPHDSNLGVLAGLGSKGVLLAPWLARQWWNHLSEGVPFDPQVNVGRFWPG